MKPELTIAVEKGYLSRTRASRDGDVWSHYCLAFSYPMVELITERGGKWTIEYDMVLTQPGEASAEEIWALAGLLDSLEIEDYVLYADRGRIGPIYSVNDAETIAAACVTILSIATRRLRYRESQGMGFRG